MLRRPGRKPRAPRRRRSRRRRPAAPRRRRSLAAALGGVAVRCRAAPPRRRPRQTPWRSRSRSRRRRRSRPRSGRRAAALCAWPSLACSSDQYSMSNMSASLIDSKRPIASASVTVSIRRLGDVGGDSRHLWHCRRARTGQEPGTRTTRGIGIEFALRHRLARVVRARNRHGSRATKRCDRLVRGAALKSSSLPALGRGQRAAANSWSGSCGRA